GVQVPGESLEVAQHLEAGHPQAAGPHGLHRRLLAVRMANDVGGVQHDLGEARRPHRPELRLEGTGQGDRVHPEVIEIHGASRLAISSNLNPPGYAWAIAPSSP